MPIVAEIEQIPSPMVQLVVNGTKVETQGNESSRLVALGGDPSGPRHATIVVSARYVPNTLLATADEVIE